MSKFKVGDRVKLVGLGSYLSCTSQGLVLGGAATVTYVRSGKDLCIKTAIPDNNRNGMQHGDGLERGWPFNSRDIELIKAAKPETNYKALCKRMSAAKTIREARAMYSKAVGK